MNGVVDKVNAWKSGNGFFFEVGGDTFVGKGTPEIAVGDKITFDKSSAFGKDGKKFFAKNIQRTEQGTIEAFIDASVEKIGKRSDYAPPGEVYRPTNDRSKTIQRLAIMKMAVRLVCAMIQGGKMPESKDAIVLVDEFAKELERLV
jgi:hypothetical protein